MLAVHVYSVTELAIMTLLLCSKIKLANILRTAEAMSIP